MQRHVRGPKAKSMTVNLRDKWVLHACQPLSLLNIAVAAYILHSSQGSVTTFLRRSLPTPRARRAGLPGSNTAPLWQLRLAAPRQTPQPEDPNPNQNPKGRKARFLPAPRARRAPPRAPAGGQPPWP